MAKVCEYLVTTYFKKAKNEVQNQLNEDHLEKIASTCFDWLIGDHKMLQTIKEIEKVTNHDVKAVEYFIKKKFDALGLSSFKEFIHFGLTSQDINNTAIPLSLKEAMNEVYVPMYFQVLEKLEEAIYKHGQKYQLLPNLVVQQEIIMRTKWLTQQLTGKLLDHSLYKKNWACTTSFPTTQIEHYDHMAALFDTMKRINTIIIDLDRDFWTYVSMDYFKQQIKAGEVGSSAMPHKHLSAKLPVSRLQRDLTDSTVLRNVGVPFAHTMIAFQSTLKGLGKLLLNKEKFEQDLENNWAVVAEAIQTILRREGYPNPYEALKGLTRTNTKINQQSIAEFIDTLEVSDAIKDELKVITPSNYTGI
ncbi:Adenylosuccinate lyase [Nymphon striatum]|nr:Adenylosuccinate lyase [Nymphon striatum]